MSQGNNTNASFCTVEDWHPHLPDELKSLTEAEWQAKSRVGNWIPFMRILGKRSTAYYRKTDVMAWFRLKFGVLHPECVQSLFDAGFPAPDRTNKRKTR
jgi:hypothetical protein